MLDTMIHGLVPASRYARWSTLRANVESMPSGQPRSFRNSTWICGGGFSTKIAISRVKAICSAFTFAFDDAKTKCIECSNVDATHHIVQHPSLIFLGQRH